MKPKVLLIAGFPNSGTTVAAIILGQHPAAFATGELTDFPEMRQFADHNICSCGRKVVECDFWLGVRDAYAHGPRGDARLAELIASHAGASLVIDVAHRIDRVEDLVANDALDLKVIHIARQRTAVLNSRLRRLYRRGIVGTFRPSRVTKVFKLGRRHEAFLRQMDQIMGRLGQRGLEVDYDQLCQDPRTWMARIGSFVDLDYSVTTERIVSGLPLARTTHLLRGGWLRRADTIVIKHDAAYLNELSPVDRWLYTVGAGAARLGIRSRLASHAR